MGLPYAFSLIGYSGGTASGFGNTRDRALGQFGECIPVRPVHVAALYTNGGDGTAMFGGGYSFNAGVSYADSQ